MAKILLVEDDRDLAGMVIDWLKFEHHLVEAVHDGEDAISMLKSYQFDVIILDWQLPKMEGVDVLRKLSRQRRSEPGTDADWQKRNRRKGSRA